MLSTLANPTPDFVKLETSAFKADVAIVIGLMRFDRFKSK